MASALFALVGVVLGSAVGLLLTPFSGVVVAVAAVVAAVFTAVSGSRSRVWMEGSVLCRRGAFGVRRIRMSELKRVEIVVRAARVAQVLLRVGDDARIGTVAVAMYTDNGGRELPAVALRSLADALASSDLASGLSVSSVLITQLRAEARDAGLNERPLYRAVVSARESGRTPSTVLSDSEVARLED